MRFDYKIIDAHCDTIGEMNTKTTLKKSNGHLDIERMKMYQNYLQVFAVWTDATNGADKQKHQQKIIIDRFYDEINKNADAIVHITSKEQIYLAWQQNKIAALLSIEGADCVSKIEHIDELYKMGVRCITLTWNGSNYIASGVGDEKADFGLTVFGKEAVKKMNELGILVDVSHLSERGFWDVLSVTNAPISATHSNSKTICAHRRNLTDEQFDAICKNGGVVGINYYPLFVNGTDKASIDDIIKHIEHFCALGGEEHIGLGSDFDGVEVLPYDLCGVEDVYKLLDRLLSLNYSEQFIKNFSRENFMRLFNSVLK